MTYRPIEGTLEQQSEVGIILPTYCEAENITKLIDEIESLDLNTSVLLIDDSSPDGTANLVRTLQSQYGNILIFVRPRKSGLGTAITDGFKIFLSLKNPPKYIITMDADYSPIIRRKQHWNRNRKPILPKRRRSKLGHHTTTHKQSSKLNFLSPNRSRHPRLHKRTTLLLNRTSKKHD